MSKTATRKNTSKPSFEEVAGKGHNKPPVVGGIEVPKLKSYIERVERLEEDKSAISQDIGDVYREAKSNGFDVKGMRAIIKLRKMKTNERVEAEYVLDLYKRALGMDIELEE